MWAVIPYAIHVDLPWTLRYGKQSRSFCSDGIPDRTGVYLQCPAVHTADTQKFIDGSATSLVVACLYTATTLQAYSSLIAARTAKPMQSTWHVHGTSTPF